ncbi:MAG: BamA/TamA family outer membrane protein, partial [Cyclobacteriaceae bacterium]|nr:BamA/TamA family outer membrane protein [Cyclobacteriaceae bacterium]
MRAVLKYMIMAIAAGAFLNCTGLKNISAEDPLFLGSQIEFTDGPPGEKHTKSETDKVLLPKPNSQFLWMRPAVARYQMLSDSARIKKFWRKKIEKPILLSHTDPSLIKQALHQAVFHTGYFNNRVEYDTLWTGKKRAALRYRITLNQPYLFDQITYPVVTDSLTAAIRELGKSSLLKSGSRYSLENIKDERRRIDRGLEEKGFINFNEDFLVALLDSVSGDRKVNVNLSVKEEIPPESRTPYFIKDIFIHDDYSLDRYQPDTISYQNYHLITQFGSLNFEKLKPGITLEPGALYTRTDYRRTVQYLNNLPLVRYVNIKFVQDSIYNRMNAMVYMTLRKRFAYSAEFDVIFRSTNFFGPGITASYTDRNFRKGGEQLKINAHGRFEMQIADGGVNPAYELGLEVNYLIPRLYPSFLKELKGHNLAKTDISVGYNLFNRLDLYRLNSIYLDFGYRWSKSDKLRHYLHAAEIIYTQVPEKSKSQDFKDYLEENPGVARSFEEQFVLGIGYELDFRPPTNGLHKFDLNVGVDLSGNLLYGLHRVFNAKEDSLGRFNLLGLPFSQYVRTKFNFVYTRNLSQSSSLVTRLFVGVGIPYGNSEVLPYLKQFYVGGSNSLRSFIARTIGPGSEVPPDGFRDLTGDIRLELNAEYRFTISGSFQSALFVDTGNMWL